MVMAAEFIHNPLEPEQEPVDDLHSFWRPLPLRNDSGGTFPEGRCSHSSTLVNGFVYLIGGGCLNAGNQVLNRFKHFSEVWRVNPESGIIEILATKGDVFSPRRGHSADVYLDRYIVIFGGVINSNEGEETLSHDLYIFDTALLTWKLYTKDGTPNLDLLDWPTPRRGHETCIYKNKLYIMGGMISREPPENVEIDTFFRQYIRVLSSLFYIDLDKLFQSTTDGLEFTLVPPNWKTKWMISYDKISAFVMSNRFGAAGVSIADVLFSMSQSELIGDRWYLWGGTLAQAGTKAGAYYIDLGTDCEFHHLAYCGKALVDARNTDCKLSVEETPNQDLFSDMPNARFSPAMCPLLEGEVLALFGGSNVLPVGNMETLDEFFSLTITPGKVPTGRSRVIAPLDARFPSLENKIYKAPPPRNGAMLTALSPTSALLSFGGKYGEVYLDDMWLLDIVRVPRSLNNTVNSKHARDSNLEHLTFYRSLLDEQRWTDVTLTFEDGERTICAHRIILASRSSYFRALFAGSFSETDKVVVQLCGMSFDATKVLIEFIYTGSFSSGTFSSPSFTAELLSLSEQLLEAKAFELCSAALINHVLPLATSCSTDLENLKFILDNINLADSLGLGGESLLNRLTQCLKLWLVLGRSQFPHLWAGLEPRVLEVMEQGFASPRLKEALARLVHSA
jgi:hypothetical protein